MAIKTSTFGGVTLTGDTAKAFRKQFVENMAPANKAAQSSLDNGKKLIKQMETTGRIKIETPPK